MPVPGAAVQVQVSLAGADRLGGQLQAVEHEVRRGVRSRNSSLRLAGSLSAPLATAALRPRAAATTASLRCTGKAAPPRPVRPDASACAISAPVVP